MVEARLHLSVEKSQMWCRAIPRDRLRGTNPEARACYLDEAQDDPELPNGSEVRMKATISLGRWFGVPVGLHYSWFIIAWLITLSLTSQFATLNRAWSPQTVWIMALVTAILFFVCIV